MSGLQHMPLGSGTRFGPYEIISAIGAGGMGEVYRARDTQLGRDVALKILPELFLTDTDRLTRFRREAQVLASLNHPNIAQIYGVEDRALVMELVSGEDLSVIIGRGPVPVAEALAIARQMADALAAAHDSGIIHRDLKPANVKVREDGVVKVLDFGLAKALESGDGTTSATAMNSPTLTARGTELGMIIGTAAYMAPEQARGKPADRRADLWAFGVVLYEMLTGRRAFDGPEVSDVLAAVLKDTPSFDALPADVPPSVRRLLGRTLQKDRTRRLDSMAAARMELDEADTPHVAASFAGTAPTRRLRRWMLPIAVTAAVILSGLIVGAAVWRLMQPPPLEVRRFSLTASSDVPLQLESNHADVAVLPDGSGIVYYSRKGNENQLVVRRFDAFDAVAFADTKLGVSARGPFVSPDGQWIGFQTGGAVGGADNRVFKVPVSGGAPVPVCALDANMRGASWTPDNTIVFATIQPATGLQRVSAAGGTPEILTKPSAADGETDHLWPFVLPDGQSVLFAITRADGSSDIALLSLATRTWRVLIKNGSSPRYVPTGHLVYGAGGTLRAVKFDLAGLDVRGDPIEVLSGVTMKESGAADFAVSTSGTLVYLPGQTMASGLSLFWRAADGGETKLGLAPMEYLSLRLSPDERFAAAVVAPAASARLWLIDLTREASSALTPLGMVVSSPVWNPDGRTIAFWSPPNSNGPGGVFQISVAGTSPPERLTTAAAAILRQTPSSWSPDGRHLLVTQVTATGTDVFDLTLGDKPVLTALIAGPTNESAPALSPDGRWVAYQVNEGIRPDVFVRPYPNVNDGKTPVSTSGGAAPRWSRDGRALYFNYAGNTELQVVQVEGTRALSFSKPARFMSLRNESNSLIVVSGPGRGGRLLIAQRPAAVLTATSEYRVVLNWTEELKARVK